MVLELGWMEYSLALATMNAGLTALYARAGLPNMIEAAAAAAAAEAASFLPCMLVADVTAELE
jgi:hypothetical protein